MNFNEYQKLAQRTSNSKTPTGKLENGCLGLAGESGECCDLLKKFFFQGHELDDVLWYIGETAAGIGVTLEEVAIHNIEKLKTRYPDGFSAERSLHRPEYENG